MNRENVKSFISKYGMKLLLLFLIILYSCICTHKVQTLRAEIEEKNLEITTMTKEHAEDLKALQEQLNVNKGNAEVIQKEIIYAQHGLREPESVTEVSLDTNRSYVSQVEEKLTESVSELPEEAYEDTDKTIVVEQPENTEVPVGIYKINTYRNWEFGTGFGVHDGDKYIPVSLQRNYDRNHSVLIEAHYDLEEHKVNGGELQWKFHF